MIQLSKILLFSYFTLVIINCQQTKNKINDNQIPNTQYQNLAPHTTIVLGTIVYSPQQPCPFTATKEINKVGFIF